MENLAFVEYIKFHYPLFQGLIILKETSKIDGITKVEGDKKDRTKIKDRTKNITKVELRTEKR
jgi:hypothetical protein